MKVALAQMEVVPGRPRKNLETMLRMIEQAKREHVDLIAFPEMALAGYLVGDAWLNDAFCRNLMRCNDEILKASHGIAVAYGNVFVDDGQGKRVFGDEKTPHPNKDGRSRKYNAVYVMQDGKMVARSRETLILPPGVEPKTLLPNYRFFDDERYFFSTEDVAKDFDVPLEDLLQPYMIRVGDHHVPVGFSVCEDLWCADYRKSGKSLNPTKIVIDNGAKLMVNISASPWTYGKNAARDRRILYIKSDCKGKFVPFLYVNKVGVQNNGKNLITFDGGSTVYNTDGRPIMLSSEPFKEELLMVDHGSLEGLPLVRTEKSMIAQKYDAIVRGIQGVKDTMGRVTDPCYVIGLSGGVDSAVVAALLVQAVGRNKVLGINMPTKYNSEQTKSAAARVAKRLGIAYEVIPIEEIVSINESLLNACDADGSGKKLSSLNEENVQAKIRGTSVLSNIAAKYGALFTNNGNKLETALGYTTLYGDVGGAVAPIADLTKVEVFELARYLNEEVFGYEVIPSDLLPDHLFRFRDDQIQPSAELRDAQVDPMKFGYHDALLVAMTDYKKKSPEDVLKWYLDGTMEENLSIGTDLMERWGLVDPKTFVEDLEWFVRSVQNSVFKRVQSPPIIITSKSSFGYDIRESLVPWEPTLEFDELKACVLAHGAYVPREYVKTEVRA